MSRQVYRRFKIVAADGSVLTPIAGAPHADPFQITSQPGVAGWKPYLVDPGDGFSVRYAIDRLYGTSEVGQGRVRIQDARVGGSNVQRWVSAFIGNDRGWDQLCGLKFVRELSVNGGADWEEEYVGRVHRVLAPEPRVKGQGAVVDLMLRNAREQQKREVFVGLPHHSVTYARPARLLPISRQVEQWASGAIRGDATDAAVEVYRTSHVTGGILFNKHPSFRLTLSLATFADQHLTIGGRTICPLVRVRIKRLDTAAEGDFYLAPTERTQSGLVAYDGAKSGASPLWVADYYVQRLGIVPLDPSHPRYMALPPAGTLIEWYAFSAAAPTKDAPLWITILRPFTWVRDLLDGKFSMLNDVAQNIMAGGVDTEEFDGSVALPPIEFDEADLAALEADDSFPPVSIRIDRVWKLEQLLASQINQLLHTATPVRADGKVHPADLRVKSMDPVAAPELDGIVRAEWESGSDTVGMIKVISRKEIYAGEQLEFPEDEPIIDVPVDLRPSAEVPTLFPTGALDGDAITLTIDAQGLTYAFTDLFGPDGFLWSPRYGKEAQCAEPYRQIFGAGAAYAQIITQRTAITKDTWPGHIRVINTNRIPNFATNERSGKRLVLCLEREGKGPETRFRFIDLGPETVALTPTFDAYAADAGNPRHGVVATVTPREVDTYGEPVIVEIAVTETDVAVRPAADSPIWIPRGRVGGLLVVPLGAAELNLAELPSGKRVWARAYGAPLGKLPSMHVFPPGDGYVDTGAIPAPTAFDGTVDGRSIVATWTNGAAAYPVMPVLDGVDSRGEPLPPGSTRYVWDELAEAANVTPGVKHVDGFGGQSAVATEALLTGGANQLNEPRALQIRQGRSDGSRNARPAADLVIGEGFQMEVRPTEMQAQLRWQLSTDELFGHVDVEILTNPGVGRTFLFTEADDVLRFIRCRHERTGFTESAWSEVASAKPTALLPSVAADLFAGGYASLIQKPDWNVARSIGSDDPDCDRVYYETALGEVYPDVTLASPYLERSQLPNETALGVLDPGQSRVLVARFWSEISGFGQTSRDQAARPLAAGAAGGSVTPEDYRSDPSLRCEYDSGVTKIVVTVPGGNTKTFNGLSGAGNLTYVVGMLLDDLTAEALLTANLTKSPYIVDYFSGAVARRMFYGDLHGPSGANAPTADVRVMRVMGNVMKARILYAGSLGVGANGPLSWRRRIDREDTGEGVWGPGGGDGWVNGTSGPFALSYEETIDRRRVWGTEVYFQTMDADGRVSRIDHVNVEGEFTREPKDGVVRLLREADDIEGMPGVEGFRATARKGMDATGAVTTWDPLVRRHLDGTLDLSMVEHGGREIRRLWAKGLSADPDTTDAFGSAQGSSYLITTANEKTGGGRGFGGFTNSSGGLASSASHFGGIEVRRMFAKALAADPDTTDALGSVQGSLYRITTTDEKTGGARGFGGFTNATGGLAATASHSGGIEVRRLFAKALAADPDTTDAFGGLQGVTYQITTVNERTGGARGFGGFKNASGGLVSTSTVEEDGVDRNVENRYRSQLRANGAAGFGQRVRGEIDEIEGNPGVEGGRAISRTGKDATGAAVTWDPLARRHYEGALDLSIVDHGSRAVNRMFAKALSADPDTTDAFGSTQGSSYQITTTVERVGGGRAANALDGSSRLQPLYSPQVLAGNIGGVQYGWTGNLLSATSSGITIAAHSVQYGWGDVQYDGNSISNLSASTKYHVYADDPSYVGGAVTYQATTAAQTVLASAGRYYVGTITTPASGTSGGGGGGAGCVASTSYVRNELRARDVARGAQLDILVGERVTEHPVQLVWEPIVRPCVRLVSESGAALVVSRDTQVTLRNGRSVAACNLAGELVAVLRDGVVRWEALTVEEIGDAEVSRLSLGGATFAAGEDPDARIFTHNVDVLK